MATFAEAQLAKEKLRENLSDFSWFRGVNISQNESGYLVLVGVRTLNDKIKSKVRPNIRVKNTSLSVRVPVILYVAGDGFMTKRKPYGT